ncbi:MAG: roadblock/LC7 domain-containing protein [Myxococcota bacterium]
MSEFDLSPLSEMKGYVASALVDGSSGMLMAEHGNAPFSLELAAAGNTEVVRAKQQTMESLEVSDEIEDILISLGNQYHIIRPVESAKHIFLYVVLDRVHANLGMARHIIKGLEKHTSL